MSFPQSHYTRIKIRQYASDELKISTPKTTGVEMRGSGKDIGGEERMTISENRFEVMNFKEWLECYCVFQLMVESLSRRVQRKTTKINKEKQELRNKELI